MAQLVFRRLSDKKIHTDAAVIDLLVIPQGLFTCVIGREFVHQHIQPRVDLAVVRAVDHAGHTAVVDLIVHPTVIRVNAAQATEVVTAKRRYWYPLYSST